MVVLRKMYLTQARESAAKVTSGVCDGANINAPGQGVLSGEAAAMEEVIALVGPRKGLRLPVSVPFHSSLLREAAEGFAELLDEVEMKDPRFPIYSNVDASRVTTAVMARDALKRQFANSVLWQASMQKILEDESVRRFVELGPKPTLVRMATQIAGDLGIDSIETRAACSDAEVAALIS
jgi:[acyl-carrier-protein] S-malonyltransferase